MPKRANEIRVYGTDKSNPTREAKGVKEDPKRRENKKKSNVAICVGMDLERKKQHHSPCQCDRLLSNKTASIQRAERILLMKSMENERGEERCVVGSLRAIFQGNFVEIGFLAGKKRRHYSS